MPHELPFLGKGYLCSILSIPTPHPNIFEFYMCSHFSMTPTFLFPWYVLCFGNPSSNICCLIPASLCDKCSVFILWFQIPISNQRGIRGNNLVAFGVFFLFEVSFLILYVFSSLGEYLAKQSRKLVQLAKVGQSILLLIKIFLTNFGSSCNAIKIWTEKQLILNS